MVKMVKIDYTTMRLDRSLGDYLGVNINVDWKAEVTLEKYALLRAIEASQLKQDFYSTQMGRIWKSKGE